PIPRHPACRTIGSCPGIPVRSRTPSALGFPAFVAPASPHSTMAVMQIHLAFGKTGLPVTLPEGFRYRVLEARSAQPLADCQSALEQAPDRPIGSPSLAELAGGKQSAAISVCDITRPAPNRKTLPPILRRLEAAGIARENITILIATGLHRAATED